MIAAMNKAISDADPAELRALGTVLQRVQKKCRKRLKRFGVQWQRRDDDPEAFQAARFRYYAIKNGPENGSSRKRSVSMLRD